MSKKLSDKIIDELTKPKSQRLVTVELGGEAEGQEFREALKKFRNDQDKKAMQLAFDVDPIRTDSQYSSVFRRRTNQLPPEFLKRIRDTEELIGGVILPYRSKQAFPFARPRPNRFDVGFTINLLPEVSIKYSEEEQQKIKDTVIPQLRELLLTCGSNSNVSDKDKRTLGQTFVEIIEDLLTFGCFAVEVRKDDVGRFHSFRAVDAGTIYFATPQKGNSQEAANIRAASKRLLEQLHNCQVDVNKFNDDHYTYVQAIEGIPTQIFTDDELLYWTSTPSTDINRSGYPISPLERVLSSITMHLNLTTHNKMFFINGRATRNVMVFKSQNLEEDDLTAIKSQMLGHINSSNAAFRMPVFGMAPEDEMQVVPLDPGSKDMEFQYLADLNKRMLFAAFQMSPDEVAALSYLSRGTNSQSLSESNNEWKLIAARDSGIRPLLLNLEDFLNSRLLPKINKEWSKLVQINLEGLDADNPSSEATRLQQDSAIYLTMNDIMERVEKEDVPIGGSFPLNAAYIQVLEKYFTKGEILKAFGGEKYKNADQDPKLAYYMADQAWFSFQQMQQQQQMMQQQAQQQQVQGQQQDPENPEEGQDLDSAMAQLGEALGKSEKVSSSARRKLMSKLNKAKKNILTQYEKDSREAVSKISEILENKCSHDEE